VQLSIDETQPASFHHEIGKRIAPLREEGVLIVGSGNLVHNLHAYAWGRHTVEPYDWARAFAGGLRSGTERGGKPDIQGWSGKSWRFVIITPA